MNSVSVLNGGELRWKDWLVRVDGGRIRFNLAEHDAPVSYDLDASIGFLYPCDSCLLVASDARLFCFDDEAGLVWQSEVLAADGVLIHEIKGGLIYGEAELDPPGGWVPFCLDIHGRRVGQD